MAISSPRRQTSLIAFLSSPSSSITTPTTPPIQSSSRPLFHAAAAAAAAADDQSYSDQDFTSDDVYDGDYYYDGAYNFENIDRRTDAEEDEPIERSNPFSLNQWFEDRNRPQPILLGDLLGTNDDDDDDDDEIIVPPPLIPVEDFAWFEPSLREIEHKYDQRRYQLSLSLQEDRAATPQTVPPEETDVLNSLLDEEMELEIREALRNMRIKMSERRNRKAQLLSPAAAELSTAAAAVLIPDDGQSSVEKGKNASRKRALYVAAQIPTATAATDGASSTRDYWAMDRLEETLLKGQDNSDQRRQLIEQQVAGMRERLEEQERNQASAPFKPTNYADWKKYQEIKVYEKTLTVDGVVNEEEVRRKFRDWKEFMARQELTMQAFSEEEKQAEIDLEVMRQYVPRENRDFANVVADINRKALQALENVLEKRRSSGGNDGDASGGGSSSSSTKELEERITKLRESLEAVNYVDVKESSSRRWKKNKRKVFKDEPVDFAQVFPRQAAKKEDPNQEQKKRSRSEEFKSEGDLLWQDMEIQSAKKVARKELEDIDDLPDLEYFSADDEEEEAPPPPPKTAFFSSLKREEPSMIEGADDDDDEEDEIVNQADYMMSGSDINRPSEERSTQLLGTYDEQRMKNLYRQGGATTEEAQEEVKQSFDDFQKYQEEMMKKFEMMDESDLGYDLSDVMTEDGDIDSEKVLSFINSKVAKATTSTLPYSPSIAAAKAAVSQSAVEIPIAGEQLDGASMREKEKAVDSNIHVPAAEDPTIPVEEEVEESFVESKEAETPKEVTTFIGKSDINTPSEERDTTLLGTYEDQYMRNLYRETGLKDKEEQEKFRQEFEDFQKYQNQAMEAFDEELKVEEVTVTEDTEAPPPLSPVASEVELGPRPSAAERKRRLAQGNGWKQPETPTVEADASRGNFLGQAEVGTVDDNEEEDVPEENFEENKRLIEQALGIKRPKDGIDMYEVLGRRPGQNEFDDGYRKEEYVFPVRRSDADLSSYQSRKNMLLERRSLSIMEVNSLMDMKDTIEVEGISPYMTRINKPFREFGAIFRLEGVLVDISTLELRAWKRVAEEIQFQPPSRDDVRFASVQTPEYAVSRIFHWTNDYTQCREIAAIHDRFINEEVKAALGGHKESTGSFIGDSTLAPVFDVAPATPVSSSEESNVDDVVVEERNDLTRNMYIIFAEKYGFRKPTASELDIAIQLSPMQAVEDVFEWAREGNSVTNIVSALKGIYDLERSKLDVFKPTLGPEVFSTDDSQSSSENGEAEVVVVDGAISWIKALLDVEMPCGLVSYLDAEIVNLIMDEAGLANLIPVDQRVSTSSGYGRDAFQQLGACLRIDRRPDMCVVFDGNADALMAARDNEMKSIGMTSIYPSYELLAADTTARTFDYLTAMNIRRLFGERDNQEPMLQEYRQEPTRPARPVMTMYPEDEKPHAGDVVQDGFENDDYDDISFDGARYYDDDSDRYYGDDKYKSRYKGMPKDGGVIYGDDKSDSDLFQ